MVEVPRFNTNTWRKPVNGWILVRIALVAAKPRSHLLALRAHISLAKLFVVAKQHTFKTNALGTRLLPAAS
ncbi:hypothetical protein [Novipirellula sp.]|uniref:hypothetical protein n=1 Tax=Novipirellula sp. TaxID=2795430 RepID=UPI0035623ED6